MRQNHHSYQRLAAPPGHPERTKIQGVTARVRAPGGPFSKQQQPSRLSGRKGGLVCLAAGLLSLTVAADTVFGEEPAAVKKPEKIVATDYASLQEAVDAAKRLNVRHLYMPPGTYDIDKTLNFTGGVRGEPDSRRRRVEHCSQRQNGRHASDRFDQLPVYGS